MARSNSGACLRRPLVAALLVGLTLALPAAAETAGDGWVWWEAEDSAEHNFDVDHPFAPRHEVLSGGEWIGIGRDRGETIFAEYTVNVPADGTYKFYARKFWKHGPFRYRFNEGPWHQVGRDVTLMDEVFIRTHLGANWVHAGDHELSAGPTKVRIELTEQSGAAAFDAFLLSAEPFTPRGKLKPGARYGRAPEGWFAFEPDRDPFNDSPIDLRGLNEPTAGSGGFIAVAGDGFVHGDTGRPVRFWAVNVNASTVQMDRAEIDHLARTYAKHGVNLVRYHSPLFTDASSPQADPQRIDDLFYMIEAFKKQGIYTHLSIYFPLWNRMNDQGGAYLGEYGYEQGQVPFALHQINPKFQQILRSWWRDLLTTKSPYSGTPLADDPAVMGVELVNEDNYFFFTFDPPKMPPSQVAILEKRFGDWAAERHGSIEAALEAWDEPRDEDAPEQGRLGLPSAWAMGNLRTARNQDAARFLAEDERAFFDGMQQFLREQLGYQGLVTATNWKTAANTFLEPVEKWANLGADFMDHHGYFGKPFQEKNNAFGYGPDDLYMDRSATRFDPDDGAVKAGREHSYSIPANILVWNDKPHMLSEAAWTLPNRFRAEQPLLMAAYGSLQGLDALVWFATGGSTWKPQITSMWPIHVPSQIGQWPAAALIFRQGLVEQAQPVVRVTLARDDVFALKGMPVAQPESLDFLQQAVADEARGTAEVEDLSHIDALAFFVGPVHVDIAEQDAPARLADLARHIDRDARTVTSATGQLQWNWGDGLVTVDAPAAQAVTGFLAENGPVELSQLRLESDMEYAAVMLVPLDGQPIDQSARLLLQVFSEESNFGWQTGPEGDWKRIESVGEPPVVVRQMSGTVSLKRPDAASMTVTALDANGYPAGDAGSADAITLQPDTLYYLIER